MANIQPVDLTLKINIRTHLENLTNPPEILGVLEKLALNTAWPRGLQNRIWERN